MKIESLPELQSPSFSNLESIGLLIFAFSAHSMFPEHENAMKDPSRFPEILNWTYFIITIEKLFFGIIAWAAWRENTEEIVTRNLGTTTRRVVSLCIGLNTWLTLPMIVVVFFRILNSLMIMPTKKNKTRIVRIFERVFGLFVCGLVAAFLPHFAVLMSCFGAASGIFLTFVCPVVIFLRLHGTSISTFLRLCYISIAFFGSVGGVVSLYLSVKRLIDEVGG
jgi:amino acid permease